MTPTVTKTQNLLTNAPPITAQTFLNCPSFVMLEVPGGSFMMGSDKHSWEQPIHQVTLSDFAIGQYPVTQEVWALVMQATDSEKPSYFSGARHPVENISWDDVQVFLQRLNKLPSIGAWNKESGRQFRLPSEAQWEYAARGGAQSKQFPFAGSHRLDEVAWYRNNSHQESKAVGLKLPNELGLYDMSGNVWEWCADHWNNNYKGAPTDGSPWLRTDKIAGRVVRGGSWINSDNDCRVSYRDDNNHFDRSFNIGFRLARY